MYDADCLEKIGANVKFLRTMRKLRQQDVAQTLGISQTHLSNMECGRVKFSLKQLLRLANNLSDAASSVISFVGVKMANKPADKEHPFGHGRIEYIAALIVSCLLYTSPSPRDA